MVRKAKFTVRGTYALSKSQLQWIQERIDKGLFDNISHGIRYCINMQRFEGKNASDLLDSITDFSRDLELDDSQIAKLKELYLEKGL